MIHMIHGVHNLEIDGTAALKIMFIVLFCFFPFWLFKYKENNTEDFLFWPPHPFLVLFLNDASSLT